VIVVVAPKKKKQYQRMKENTNKKQQHWKKGREGLTLSYVHTSAMEREREKNEEEMSRPLVLLTLLLSSTPL